MMVLLGDKIRICAAATLSEELILLTIDKKVYTVNMVLPDVAKMCYERLLEIGYVNFTGYEYSN